jgi:EAL domain-containing protein (putative c-di-GMP-specific phosphodiesterase class I)
MTPAPLEPIALELTGIPVSAIEVKPALGRSLRAIREHLGMDVAFISQIVDGRRCFREVDIGDSPMQLSAGDSAPAEESYCQRVIDGRLPELIPDACMNAEALTLAATRALPVGAHLSVPIRLADGRTYGTFCCFSHTPDATLTPRDLAMMRVFADMVGVQIQEALDEREARRVVEQRIGAVMGAEGLNIVYQPIIELETNRLVAFECLSRFAAEPYRSPDIWFTEAASVGRGVELETRAIRLALAGLAELPPSVYLSVNASPETLMHGHLEEMFAGLPLGRIVVELTEHQAIERYEDIAAVVAPLQQRGLRLAIDDAGAGYASFRHVVNLHPHIVKLDISITRAIDQDASRRALAAALCGFAGETGCKIVAEGVETAAELAAIRKLRIGKAQGHYLGRPMPLDDAVNFARRHANGESAAAWSTC